MLEIDPLEDLLTSAYSKDADNIERYFAQYPDCKNWGIVSDYCIDVKDEENNVKGNDVFVYAIFPRIKSEAELCAEVQNEIKKDLKRTKNVKESILNYLKENPLFFINAFVVSNRNLFLNIGAKDEKEAHKKMLTTILTSLKPSLSTENYLKLKKLSEILEPNKPVYKSMMINAIFAAFMTRLIASKTNAESVKWYSDRDGMMEYCNGVIRPFYDMNVNYLLYKRSIRQNIKYDIEKYKVTHEKKTHLPYDPIVRIPDYIAGTLAFYNLDENLLKTGKRMNIVESVILGHPRMYVSRIMMEKEYIAGGRTNFHPENEVMPENFTKLHPNRVYAIPAPFNVHEAPITPILKAMYNAQLKDRSTKTPE
ncbi:MAG: hypothetical protein LBU87_04375 [Lactobacillales bacterium]|jgi:hypothetical protein|nr:hypothetical protein [Lactobacillales bacterium]